MARFNFSIYTIIRAIPYIRAIRQSKMSINNVLDNISNVYQESLQINQISELLSLSEETNTGKIQINCIENIEVKHLFFKYPGEEDYVLENISFSVKKGEKLVLVGLNGSGKTTLLKLIIGFYDDYEGEILVNGIERRMIDKCCYQKKISAVFQDYTRFEATYKENISYGDVCRMNDDGAIKSISDILDLDEIIENKKEGLNTQLGNWFDDGCDLSSGQWQRIALARAFFKESDLYALDEPDAALDAISKMKIEKAYDKFFENKIAIIISHRLNEYTCSAREIVVLMQGRIYERGTHDELYRANGIYRVIWDRNMNNPCLNDNF